MLVADPRRRCSHCASQFALFFAMASSEEGVFMAVADRRVEVEVVIGRMLVRIVEEMGGSSGNVSFEVS
jgi:hypothetical protein